MALDLDKLVQDAKRSPNAKGAVVFLIENIATLINDAGGDPERARQLMDQLNLRKTDMADSVIDNRDVTPPAPHHDTDRTIARAHPTDPQRKDEVHASDEAKRDRDTPKPRLDPGSSPRAAEMDEGKKALAENQNDKRTVAQKAADAKK